MNAEETKRRKAEQLRYKKPIVKNLNLDQIREELCDIQEECENVHWYYDTDEDTLINALDGDEDQAHEFKMMFADLCAECEKMFMDLREEWVPDCFDCFFVAIGAGRDYGGILGFDSYEQDYFGISCSDVFAEDESKKVLRRLTKDNLIAAARQCFQIYVSFIGLRYRYDCLKAALDILKDENTGYLKMVKQLEELYDRAAKEHFYKYGEATQQFDRATESMPPEAWLQ